MNNKVLFSIIAVVLLLSIGGYKYYEYKNPQIIEQLKADQKTQEIQSSNIASNESSLSNASQVQITTEVPVNGTKMGVIEVGASGFNAFVINVDKNKNWELVSKTFGESLAIEGFATTQDVYEGMKKYLAIIFEQGVAGRNVHFVVSSGALKHKNSHIIVKAIKEKGFVVNTVTADEEGKYALKALLPKSYRNNSFVVDMGSGNTKISWYDNGKITSVECAGAKYYQNNTPDEQVYNEVKQAISKIPSNLKQNCFIIGGVPFKLAKEVRNGEERFTKLAPADDYSSGDDIKLKSGLNIYRAIETSDASQVIFDWDANFTIGVLLTLK